MATLNSPVSELLAFRAYAKGLVRDFFAEANVLEVDVPALGLAAVTDPHIDAPQVEVGGKNFFLQSSPEYFMKRLIAWGGDDMYSLNYAYREGEFGRKHRPEFTMLEWYRLGWDEHRLMIEVASLLQTLGFDDLQTQTKTYAEAFNEAVGKDYWACDLQQLQTLASDLSGNDFSDEPQSSCLDLIFSLKVEPTLTKGLVFITDYPACQAALAKIEPNKQGQLIARRFEAFIDGLEIANGYYELTDADELRARFLADQQQRQELGKPHRAIDEDFLAAMESGMPSCAGVAMGFDRVLMKLLGKNDIADILPFG